METEPSDPELLARHRSGDRAAFALLVARFERSLVRYASGLTGDLEQARDAVQEAFLRLAQGNGAVPDSPTAWLFQVTRHQALDRIRKESRMRAREHAAARPEATPPGASPLETDEQDCAVARQLATLRPEVREVLALKVIEGLSYRQIAEVTGRSSSHIGDLVHQGLGQLARALRAAGVV